MGRVGPTRHTAVLVHHDEIRHFVGATRLDEVLDDIVAAVDPVRVRKDQPHLLVNEGEWGRCQLALRVQRMATRGRGRTLANCSSRELGSRDVVMTILGSYSPTLAYSSSIWLPGSGRRKMSKEDERVSMMLRVGRGGSGRPYGGSLATARVAREE